MGIHDRPYMHEGSGGGPVFRSGIGVGLPRPGPAIKWLLIINIAAFIFQAVFEMVTKRSLSAYFGATLSGFWQLWRYVTFQFLHAGFWHVGLNMLGLYFLGMPLESKWGTRRFLKFYLSCGLTAGAAYVFVAALLDLDPSIPLIGASGGVFGVILAAAVYFPQFKLLLFFFLPVPIRLAAVIIFGGMILYLLQAASAGIYANEFWSHVAHLGGTVTAAVWIWGPAWLIGSLKKSSERRGRGAWKRKMKRRAAEQAEIDRILRKIHAEGINSLTAKEKRILQKATHEQQTEDRAFYRR